MVQFAWNDNDTLTRVQVTERRLVAAPRSGQTQSGYGVAVPTDWVVRIKGHKQLRRVYTIIHSNIGTLYVRVKGICYALDGLEDAPHHH